MLEFILPGLPKTTNGSKANWRAKMAEARKWKNAVIICVSKDKPDYPLSKAQIIYTRISSQEPDFDGLVSSFKHVQDGLIDVGIIENDKPSNIGQPHYRWIKGKPKKGAIIVRIQELY